MPTQLTLFPEYVNVNPLTDNDFYQALHQGLINNVSIEWTCKRAFLANKIQFSIIPVDELTIIPAWKTLCNDNVIEAIEKSPYHNLYVKIEDNRVIGASKNIIDLLTTYEVTVIYQYWNM